VPKSRASRPQCMKDIPNLKPEARTSKARKCKMPLDANGRCPEHGYDTGR
jgi:hypothetical protein